MQANSQCHNYFTLIWLFESGNCGEEGKNYKKLNISRKKSFLDEIKTISHNFWNAFFCNKKYKNTGEEQISVISPFYIVELNRQVKKASS